MWSSVLLTPPPAFPRVRRTAPPPTLTLLLLHCNSPRPPPTAARLVAKWMVAGLRSLDPLWVGPGASRFGLLLAAVAKVWIADEERREEAEDGDWSQYLIEDADVVILHVAAKELKASANGPAIATAFAAMPQVLRQTLARLGF